MSLPVRLETITHVQPLAVVRRRAARHELSRVVPEACGIVWSAIKARQIRGGRHVAIYFDDAINLEVGVEVDAPFTGDGEVIASALPTGRVATSTHYGPYSGLGGAYRAIHDWCAANGQASAGICWEIYGHWQSDWDVDPSKIRTDVFVLLKNGSVSPAKKAP
jgi:effector-binding domain-containing protein